MSHKDTGNINININSCPNELVYSPAYGNFWRTQNAQIQLNQAVPFTQTGPTAGGVSLLNPTTIRIQQAGDYYISYVLTVLIDDPNNETDGVSAFLNNVEVANFQTKFQIRTVGADDVNSVLQISGIAIISVPANANLQIRNTGRNPIDLFAFNNNVNSAAIALFKLS